MKLFPRLQVKHKHTSSEILNRNRSMHNSPARETGNTKTSLNRYNNVEKTRTITIESCSSLESNLDELKGMITDVKDSLQVKSINPLVPKELIHLQKK